jgi:hypothetical protein
MASSSATSPAAYLKALPPDRRKVVSAVRALVNKCIPKGYTEMMGYGMISWSVPLSVYAETYNGQPLTYVGLVAQKNKISLHLLSAYGHKPALDALQDGFKKAGKRLDMGKGCLRFKTLDDLDLPSIEQAIAAVPMDRYVAFTRAAHAKRTRRGLLRFDGMGSVL